MKARLLGNTNPGPVGNPFVDGHGALNVYAAATSGPMNLNQSGLVLLLATAAGPGVRRGTGPSFRRRPGAERPGNLVTAGCGATCAA